MATGRKNKIVGQTGEYLVAAELSRRGLIATTFTGNVPHYDIIASNEHGFHVSIQVKAISGKTWQFSDVRQFFKIELDGKKQIIGNLKDTPVKDLIYVMVKLNDYGSDNFYILQWHELRDIIYKLHKDYLIKHDFIRPKRFDSFHSALSEKDIIEYKDRWDLIEDILKKIEVHYALE